MIPRVVMLEREQKMRVEAGEVARKARSLHRLVATSVDVRGAGPRQRSRAYSGGGGGAMFAY